MKFAPTIILTLLLISCGSTKQATTGKTVIWEISPELADCEGISVQECMQVRKKGASNWTLFYDSIKGFNYIEGTNYTVKLEKTEVANYPADGSTISYELLEVLDQKEITTKSIKPSFRGYFVITHINSNKTELKDLSFKIDYQKRRVYGFSGCNNYNVPFLSSGNKLRFEPVTSTKKSCLDTKYIEEAFHSIFKQVRTYSIVNGKLTLYNKKGIELMRGQKGSSY